MTDEEIEEESIEIALESLEDNGTIHDLNNLKEANEYDLLCIKRVFDFAKHVYQGV